MSTAQDYTSLAEDIADAYQDRVKRIKEIKKDTEVFIGECKKEDRAG